MRILAVGVNWLGDAVMTLPALQSLRAMFPDAAIDVATRPDLAGLYAASPAALGAVPFDARDLGFFRMGPLAGRLRGYDAAVVFPRSFRSALLVRRAGIPKRIGYAADARSFLLTDALPRPKSLLAGHRVLYYHALLRTFGDPPPPRPAELRLPPEAERRAEELLGSWCGLEIVAVHAGASYGLAKQWLADRFADVVRGLNRPVAVIGGPDEAARAEQLASRIGPQARPFAGKTDLLALAALLRRCRLLLCNDSGPMHVADAVGTPVVAVFGSTDPRTTRPFQDRHTIVRHDLECSPCLERTCPLGHHNCMERIASEEVLRAVNAWLR